MSLMEQYADTFGIELSEVSQWVNSYASGDVPDSVREWMEPTKSDRIESIKAYIQREVDDSLTSRIKGDILNSRIEKAECKEVQSCPF